MTGLILPQKLLCQAQAPVHQHMGDQHQCPHRCRRGASGHAQGLHTYTFTHTHTCVQQQMHYCGISFDCLNRLVPVPRKRTKRLLPLYLFPCQRSETWTLPMMPARSWSPLWGSFNMATLLRMSGGTGTSMMTQVTQDGANFMISYFIFCHAYISGLWRSSWRTWFSLCVWYQITAKMYCPWSPPHPTERDRNSWGNRTSSPRSAHSFTTPSVCSVLFWDRMQIGLKCDMKGNESDAQSKS